MCEQGLGTIFSQHLKILFIQKRNILLKLQVHGYDICYDLTMPCTAVDFTLSSSAYWVGRVMILQWATTITDEVDCNLFLTSINLDGLIRRKASLLADYTMLFTIKKCRKFSSDFSYILHCWDNLNSSWKWDQKMIHLKCFKTLRAKSVPSYTSVNVDVHNW